MSPAIEARLRVVVDMDTVDPSGERGEYLLGLLRREEFELYRYSDEGPPLDHVGEDLRGNVRYGIGWLLYEPKPDPGYDYRGEVSYSNKPPSWHMSRVMAGDFLPVLVNHAANRLGKNVDQEQLGRDVMTLLIAQASSAHLLVTERPALHDLPSDIWHDKVQPCSVETALTMVGFWLRAKGTYAFQATEKTMAETDRHEFYAAFLQDLVPAAHRWSRACSLADDPTLHDLAVSSLGRVITALKVRDRAHTAGFFMTDASAQDEALECVDAVALYLMGAFDGTARAANKLLSVNEHPNWVGWQHTKWRKKLPPAVRGVAVAHRDTVAIISELRNTVHHESTHIGVISNPRPDDDAWYVVLPNDTVSKVTPAMKSAGGLKSWGFRETVPGHLWMRPFKLIDQMIVRAAEALDDLIAATAESTASVLDDSTDQLSESWLWNESSRRRIRWQIGGGLQRRADENRQRESAQPPL